MAKGGGAEVYIIRTIFGQSFIWQVYTNIKIQKAVVLGVIDLSEKENAQS